MGTAIRWALSAVVALLSVCVEYTTANSGLGFINPVKHDIIVVDEQVLNQRVAKHRKHFACIIYAVKSPEESKSYILNDLNVLSKDLNGLGLVGVVDCGQWPSFCEQPFIKQLPAFVVYPPLPVGPFLYEGEVSNDALAKVVSHLISSSNVKALAKSNFNSFSDTGVGIPKVILFTQKSTSPPLFNALANHFYGRMRMGFVDANNENCSSIIAKFQPKAYPSLLLITNDGKTQYYKGEIKFEPLHAWLNIYSETFVAGGLNSQQPPLRYWLTEKIPEMSKASHNDICFAKDKCLCVIYLKDGGPLTDDEKNMLVEHSVNFISHVENRGTQFRWMWMDVSVEKEYKKLFDISVYPSVVVFNPHKKRPRFVTSSKVATSETIKSLLDIINGGDARFISVPGGVLPSFADRNPEKKCTNCADDEL